MAEATVTEYRTTSEAQLKALIARVLEKVGVAADDAVIVADVLAAADLRGIESHGSARLESYYVSRLRAGGMSARPDVQTVRETETSLLVDAGNGLGHPVTKRTMDRVIEKARKHGAAFAAIRNSNHYGIAGYYAMMALEHGLIGVASTNSVRYGTVTNGKAIMLGTNPLAFAIPTAKEPPFVLDFATTTVPRGKLEVYNRKALELKPGWSVDAEGRETRDPQAALKGALLPLGGFGTEGGGHKGYGLGLLVDILCGVLSGGAFGNDLPLPNSGPEPGKISHFLGAIRVDAFRDLDAFKADMDRELRAFKDSARAPGAERIYVAGEIEHENTLRHRREGVPVHVKVWDGLEKLSGDLGIPFELGPA
jgi:LDH2 family malate/lactate/ureidoglycolate dehydrogenase